MNIETVLRTIIREELSLDQAIREKRAGWPIKERLYALAQEIVDEVKPGEKVQEVLINTNSAEPLTEVIEQAKELLANNAKPKKTVYTVMFSGSASVWPSKEDGVRGPFTSMKDAVAAIEKSEGKSLYTQYFVKESEVDA